MIKKLIPIFVMLLILTPVHAQTYEYCKDNTTLVRVKQVTINIPERNVTRTLNATEEVNCPYGCDMVRNECIQPPFNRYLIILGIIVFIVFMILILWRFV